MMNYQQVTITVSDPEQRDILIALLADIGYEGFTEERDTLRGYIALPEFDEALLHEIVDPMALSFTLETIPQQNWNAAWESSFEPVVVPGFCAVRADFHEPQEGVLYDIVVTPKMSFGTGHHATTFQMLEAMGELVFSRKSVFDFGTGTGVLAILAEKMGAETVLAIDNDDWSIDNAGENFSRNGCNKVALRKAENLDGVQPQDIILANINKRVILPSLPALKQLLKPDGVLVISGLLAADIPDAENAIASAGLTLIKKQEKESWICWTLKA
ncbi:50S ribosomal protein L11 methyltransferase [Flavihumibacter petaseus]|uniref:Ribosomal protein L11 methyltransferase n=1 Tax=Flavihumibacter petaseus NBRC 106054 TaxID=1220578 RepID=A0A0E9N2M9_9BACT|nr:50S ribosomal protein L11 methyltransferase [Flavihumibacter petaseus]GAO43891.1 ribosomal protein L11 methyltransferase [Flavihumibacter petaseus NBRC 106054]